ncbi:MAG: hypothetical protein N3E45_14360 [Oscillatoriaceae bacterium SKW80]|nr:hypothetical protein [Oscillatoriaceae bacterium SKW80]
MAIVEIGSLSLKLEKPESVGVRSRRAIAMPPRYYQPPFLERE